MMEITVIIPHVQISKETDHLGLIITPRGFGILFELLGILNILQLITQKTDGSKTFPSQIRSGKFATNPRTHRIFICKHVVIHEPDIGIKINRG